MPIQFDPTFGRTTANLTRDTILSGLNRAQSAILLLQQQLSSGKRIIRPSIDPVGATLAMGYRGRIERNGSYVQNANDATSRLGQADSALGSIADLLDSARVVALAQANGTASTQTRASSATEIAGLLTQAVAFSNASFNGRFLFGGAAGPSPFTRSAGGVAFGGDLAAILRSFGDALIEPDNLSAPNALGATALLEARATGSATAASVSTSVEDSSFIGHGASAYVGFDLVVRTGPNAGQAREITAFSSATGTFTVAAPFTSAFIGGEGFDIRMDLDPTLTRGGKGTAATAASGAGTIVSANLVGDGDNSYNSLELLVTSGANAGSVRQVTDFDSATGTLTFGTPFGSAFAAGDTLVMRAASTSLGQLRGGTGVSLGSVLVSDGVGGPSVSVDLSGARDIGDVLDAFNNAFAANLPAISAGLNAAGNGLELTHSGAGTIVVADEGGGTTAAQLGIATGPAGVAVTLTGTDLDPVLSQGTQLAQMRGGLGLDKTGFTVDNGNLSATISLASAFTIEDLRNAVAGANVSASVEIAPDGRSLSLRQRLSGADLRVTNSGGATASTLGWLDTLRRASLDQLNADAGVLQTPGPDFRVTTKTGATFDVDLGNAKTIADVVDLINANATNVGLGSPVLARVDETTGALVLEDTGADTGSDFSVQSLNNSAAAASLGIEQTVTNPAGVDPTLTLTGTALNAAGLRDRSPFAALLELQNALLADDAPRIARAADRLSTSRNTVLAGRAEAGSRGARLTLARNRHEDETLVFQELLSATEDTDFADAATRLAQEEVALQASLATAARILQTSLFEFLQ